MCLPFLECLRGRSGGYPVHDQADRLQQRPARHCLAGESKEEVLRSPFLERLKEEGLEVILFTDAIDEYMMQHLQEYDDRKLINISKDNLKLGGKDKEEKAADKALKARLPLS